MLKENICENDEYPAVDQDRGHVVPVLHLVISLDMGGLEVMVVDFIKKMDKRRYRPLVCCLDSKGALAQGLEDEGIEVISLGRRPGFDLRLILKLAGIIKERQVKILHTHNWSAHFYGALSTVIRKVPVVIHTQHGRHHDPFTWKKKYFAPLTGRFIDKFVGVSNDVSEYARTSGWVPQDKVHTILNGIDSGDSLSLPSAKAEDRKRVRQELGISQEATVIVNVARLTEVKDHVTLLKAFSRMKRRSGPLSLVIVGYGPLLESLKHAATDLQIEKSVVFTGMRRDVPVILNSADIFALSSRSEGIAISLIEAMRAGLPIVATDVGGNSEVVRHGATGLLVPKENPELFSMALEKLAGDPGLRKKMGVTGRNVCLETFGLDRMMAQYMDIYKEILAKKGVLH